MCGFVSLLTFHGRGVESSPAVDAAVRQAQHRGPDRFGTWCDADVAMAFQRLTIVDAEGSDQPHRPGDGRCTAVFNGEIYNHRALRAELAATRGTEFTTEGEVEVIVEAYRAWGAAAFSRFRGMFAVVLWDSVERVLIAARDPFGIKPMYLMAGPGGVALASEKKSLLELAAPVTGRAEPAVDPDAVQQYLLLQYVPEPGSLHRGIERVESGTHVRITADGHRTATRYFRPVLHCADRPGPAPSAVAAALRDSVRAHLQADVPVGALLSGGIDSTAVAALAARAVPRLMTFTVGFPERGYSEIEAAAASAAALGVPHVGRTVTAAEVADALPSIVWALDDPVADPALVPLWFVAREARRHVGVVLSGEGADELFGGYRIYREPRSLAGFDLLPSRARTALAALARRLPDGVRGKDLLRRQALTLEQRYYGGARVFRDDQLGDVLRTHDPSRTTAGEVAPHYRDTVGWDPVSRMQHVDLFTWLRGDILVKADRMTMAHGLELRVPFLDPEVLAVAARLGPRDKVRGTTTKHALRHALRGVVPDDVVLRPKLGFPVPVGSWLRGELHDWARGIVRSSLADRLIDLDAAAVLLDRHRRGEVDAGRRLWSLIVLLLWHGIFVEHRIVPVLPEPRVARPAPPVPGAAAGWGSRLLAPAGPAVPRPRTPG